jgi:hypothetical protein
MDKFVCRECSHVHPATHEASATPLVCLWCVEGVACDLASAEDAQGQLERGQLALERFPRLATLVRERFAPRA